MTDPNNESPEAIGAANAVDKLAHVVDDTGGREEAVEWAKQQLIGGMSFSDLSAELQSLGWAEVSAESIVEEAREATRAERGVRTRDDVAVGAYRKFSKTLRRIRWIIILAIVGIVYAIYTLLKQAE